MPEPAPIQPADRLRAAHLEMLDAVLSGDGLPAVAELAARAAGGPVVVAVPRLGVAAASTGAEGALGAVRRYFGERPAPVPAGVVAEAPIASGDERLGGVVLLEPGRPEPGALEVLHAAALAALTEVAVHEAREEVRENARGTFLAELRAGALGAADAVRRAARLGCDLSRGAVVLCAELTTGRPGHLVALVASEHPGALAHRLGGRVYALLPGDAGAARALAARLERHGVVGLSAFCEDPAELGRAIEEAELASRPEDVRALYEATVAPAVRYDDQYRTELVATLEAFIEHGADVDSTTAALYALRHTVAYRLERVRELTGLDPARRADRERLALGMTAYRVVAPTLPR